MGSLEELTFIKVEGPLASGYGRALRPFGGPSWFCDRDGFVGGLPVRMLRSWQSGRRSKTSDFKSTRVTYV